MITIHINDLVKHVFESNIQTARTSNLVHQERLKLNDDLEKQISYFFPHQKLGTKSSCCLNVWLRNVFYQIMLFNCDLFLLTDDENWYYQLLSMYPTLFVLYLIYLGLLYFLFCKCSQGMTFKIGWKITDFF